MRNPLYDAIWKVREACAGCNVQPDDELLSLLRDAMKLTKNSKSVYWTLRGLELAVKETKTLEDRLPIDRALCDLLNNIVPEEIETKGETHGS